MPSDWKSFMLKRTCDSYCSVNTRNDVNYSCRSTECIDMIMFTYMYISLVDITLIDTLIENWQMVRVPPISHIHECIWFTHALHDVIKWRHFPRYWPFVRGIHRSPVNSPHKGQWRGALMLSLICVWINDWVNNREAGDLRRYRVHYDFKVMI